MLNNNKRIQKIGLIMVLLNAYATPLMLSATNIALPSIARDLALDAVALSWIPTAYLMASAMFTIVFGALADIYGLKRFFLSGMVCIILTSVLAAAAINGLMLIGARFLQGISAAMLYATQIAIVSALFAPAQRGRMIGLTLATTYIGLASGPVLGGLLVDTLGWRASFLLHIPLLLLSLLIGFFMPKEWPKAKGGCFDKPGALLYCAAILFLCIGVAFLPYLYSFLLLGLGGLFVVFFFRHAGSVPQPLFDVNLFYINRVFFCSCIAALLLYTACYANMVLVGLYLQYIKEVNATTAGLLLLAQPLTIALFSPLAGHLSDRIEPRIIASIGLFLITLGLFMLTLLEGTTPFFYLLISLFITGSGLGLFTSPNTNAIMGVVKRGHYARAASAVSLMRILGQMSSMLLVTLVFTLTIGASTLAPTNYQELLLAIKLSFAIAVLLCLLGLFFSLQRGRIHNDEAA